MQIDRLGEHELTPALDAEIAALLLACFDTDFGGRSYYQQRHHIRFTARIDGALLGHLALCYRDIRVGDTLTSIWGLGEVATVPSARGKGVATRLLAEAISFARSTPAAFFLLFGDRPIYAANGFVHHPNPITFLGLDGARTGAVTTTDTKHLMVLPLGDQTWDGTVPLDLLGHKF